MKKEENSLLIFSQNGDAYLKLIRQQRLPGLADISVSATALEALEQCGNCNIIFGEPHRISQLLPHADKLEWVQSTWAGVTPLLAEGCRRDYLLTGVKGIFGPMMSEYVFCYMLMHERKAWQRYRSGLRKKWDETRPGMLKGKRVGIMGVGSIGAHIAKTAKHFGMQTSGYTRNDESCQFIDGYFHGDQLMAFVSDLDYLVCVLPNVSGTDGLIDAPLLKAMKKNAVLINVGRGNVIDEAALAMALTKGQIAGAVLDVFNEEPLPPDHPFWTAPNLIVTAHTAALSFPEDIVPVFVENYRNFISGKPLDYVIDFERGY